jgi:hypothetical protein
MRAVRAANEEIIALRAEIERLRAALEVFACDCEGEELCFNTDNCRNFIARAALEGRT